MKTRRESGAAAVEMAFTLVLLIWLVLGIIDVGRAIFTNIALQDAVQAGVSYAAFTEDADPSDVANATIASTTSVDLTGADFDIDCYEVTRTDQDGTRVEVTITYELGYITPLVGQALGDTLDLSKHAETERFYPSCSDLGGGS